MNEATDQRPPKKWRWLRMLGTLVTCCAILGGAVAAIVVINQTEPTAQKDKSSRKSSALVETVTVERGTYSPRLVVLGTVQAAQDIVLTPRVRGQVTEMSEKLVPGGMIDEGELLFRIDPADFENALSIRNSELAQAEASREIEQARQRLAEKELKMLEGSIDGTNRSLVMREPQIASIEAEVAAAEAAVERATLDLDRTSVHAPFTAQVLSRSVNVGSQIGPGDEVARLIGLKEYWIMAAVPVRTLRWVQLPESGTDSAADSESENIPADVEGSKVILRNPEVWGADVERHARVARMIGTLDNQTRLARVLIVVDDPLGQESGAPPLILNSLLETEIEGRPIVDVVRLKRDFVRDGDTVWVMAEDKLQIRETEVVFRDVEFAYIRSGLESGDEVVTTTLATVAEGIGLRKVGQPATEEAAVEDTTSATDETEEDNAVKDAPEEEPDPTDESSDAEPAVGTDASNDTEPESGSNPDTEAASVEDPEVVTQGHKQFWVAAAEQNAATEASEIYSQAQDNPGHLDVGAAA